MIITAFKSAPADARRGIFRGVYGLLWGIIYVLVEWLLREGMSYWLLGRVFFTIPIGPNPCKVGNIYLTHGFYHRKYLITAFFSLKTTGISY